jgi:isoleucyl-tRNA synthetase
VFKQLHEKGLVYRGFKVMPFSTACSTPLSNFEAGLNYKDVDDPAVMVSVVCVCGGGVCMCDNALLSGLYLQAGVCVCVCVWWWWTLGVESNRSCVAACAWRCDML